MSGSSDLCMKVDGLHSWIPEYQGDPRGPRCRVPAQIVSFVRGHQFAFSQACSLDQSPGMSLSEQLVPIVCKRFLSNKDLSSVARKAGRESNGDDAGTRPRIWRNVAQCCLLIYLSTADVVDGAGGAGGAAGSTLAKSGFSWRSSSSSS